MDFCQVNTAMAKLVFLFVVAIGQASVFRFSFRFSFGDELRNCASLRRAPIDRGQDKHCSAFGGRSK
jgi:hypothetical protein